MDRTIHLEKKPFAEWGGCTSQEKGKTGPKRDSEKEQKNIGKHEDECRRDRTWRLPCLIFKHDWDKAPGNGAAGQKGDHLASPDLETCPTDTGRVRGKKPKRRAQKTNNGVVGGAFIPSRTKTIHLSHARELGGQKGGKSKSSDHYSQRMSREC